MKNISDAELLAEIKRRLDDNRKALYDLEMLTRKLESVNRKLQESETMKSNFLSNIRNEINNPLSAILALSDQLMTGHVDAAMAPDMSRLIHQEAFELDFQLRNIFLAAEIEAGETPLSAARIDVCPFLKRIISSFDHRILQKALRVDVLCDLQSFTTDPEKYQAIIVNLLANAIEYSLKGKSVTVAVRLDDGRLITVVEDEGVGIPNDERKHIYDRFEQLEVGSKKAHKGHGLGLSIVKALTSILEGSIEFSSVVGKGTRFEVVIPEYKGDAALGIVSEDGNEIFFESEKEEEF